MVGRCRTWITSGHVLSLQTNDESRRQSMRSGILWVIKTENQYKTFNKNQIIRSKWRYLWTQYFIEHKGYNIKYNEFNQDNHSTILLENNGIVYSSKRTRHINIHYFFITDRIKKGELRVQFCPTDEMKPDFFTKPLQGELFWKFRDWLINIQYDYPLAIKYPEYHRSVLKEVNTLKKYSINLTTLSRKMYHEIKKDDINNTGIID